MLSGFDDGIATCYKLNSPLFGYLTRYYASGPYDNYEIIGKRKHGAMYTFRKCARNALSLEAGLRLACFTLLEVGNYDVTIGGPAQLYVLRPNEPFENCSTQMETHREWANSIGEKISRLILEPTSEG